MAKVIFQTGLEKSKKRTQSIKVFINDEAADRSDNDDGFFLTARTDWSLKGLLWYMNSYDLCDGDTVRIEVETYINNIGKEELLTFERLYMVDSSAAVEDFNNPKVGYKGYPLIKGRVLEIYAVSEDDKRRQNIEDQISEGF